jgi:hypothetical protein
MAVKEKKQVRKVRFELTWGGIAGIVVICICIFLWMFVLGVWTGQSLLQPSLAPQKSATAAGPEGISLFLQKDRNRQ